MFRYFKKFSVVLIITILSLLIGSGIAFALNYSESSSSPKSVDRVTGKYKIGEELYLENCSSCHIPIPPAVLPRETWKNILEKPLNHYGTSVENLKRLDQVVIWDYVSFYSRNLLKNEPTPELIAQSRYFFALHPKVNLPNPITHNSCVTCHKNAMKFDYRINE